MPGRYAAAHASYTGAGDSRPTAQQIISDEGLAGKLTGLVFLITGGSGGLGEETARVLLTTGATVYITARDAAKGGRALSKLKASNPGPGSVHLLNLDLNSLASVRKCAADFQKSSKQLHCLIANAGALNLPKGRTEDSFELHLAPSMAHFLLFELLRPTLLASSTPERAARAVWLSSSNHRLTTLHLDDLNLEKSWDPTTGYAQAKLADLYFASEAERRYGAQGLHSWAVHPGGIAETELARSLDPEVMKGFVTEGMIQIFKTTAQGAATTVWAATAEELEGKGGLYLEDCSTSEPQVDPASHPATPMLAPGHAPHAYDEAAAKQLWEAAAKLTGLA